MNFTVNNRTYWVEDEGTGPPLLFLHGFTGSTNIWKEVKRDLQGLRMVSVDLPGHGKTGHIGIVSMEEAASDLKAILYELNIEKLSLAGYSMGGRTALFFASMYPGMVDRLILESASPGLKTEEERKERIRKDRNVIELLENHGVEAFTDKWEQLPLFSTIKELPATRRDSLRQERLANDKSGLIASLEGMGTGVQPSLWHHLDSFDKPVCLIVGKEDAKYKKLNEEMSGMFPQAQLHLVKNAGHIPHLEKPDIFSEIVRQFMI